jgi:hypothetical protein
MPTQIRALRVAGPPAPGRSFPTFLTRSQLIIFIAGPIHITKVEAKAPTNFRERPKKPPLVVRRDSLVLTGENEVPAGAAAPIAAKIVSPAAVAANVASKVTGTVTGASSVKASDNSTTAVKAPVTAAGASILKPSLPAVEPVSFKGRGTFTYNDESKDGSLYLEDTVDSDDAAELLRASTKANRAAAGHKAHEAATALAAFEAPVASAVIGTRVPATGRSIEAIREELNKLKAAKETMNTRPCSTSRVRFTGDVKSIAGAAIAANIGRPVNITRPATPPLEPSVFDESSPSPSPASSPIKGCRNGDVIRVVEVTSTAGADQVALPGFYVDKFVAEAAFEMLKKFAIKKGDHQEGHKVWHVKGVKL